MPHDSRAQNTTKWFGGCRSPPPCTLMTMEAERWERLESVFLQASELAPDERSAYLDRECGDDEELRTRIEAMLAADGESVGGAIAAVHASVDHVLNERTRALVDRSIGAYRLVREIGRGGMGVVYLGEAEDGSQAAVKILLSAVFSEQVRRRFDIERAVLADLEHPNIAGLLDGGETEEGLPYVVMEYVDGVPVTAYCERERLNLRRRLWLFLRICEAVAHAHSKLVVHRDIKPGNILVTRSGDPKLLDFGIAKLLAEGADSPTRTGIRVLTPGYASPEQVRGETVGVASDIYSLGVLLYTLLTDRPPLEFPKKSPLEVARIVCNTEPEPPSVASGNRSLEGRLDRVVLKALSKEPSARYPSVDRLARELQAHLDGDGAG